MPVAGFPVLNCVDMSKWGGELAWQEAQCLRDRGIDLVIVGTGNPRPGGAGQWSRQQATMAAAAGLRVQAYIYLYMMADPIAQVEQGMVNLEGLPIERWWLDAEDVESPALRQDERVWFLQRCVTEVLARGGETGVYTGRWWWRPNMGLTMEFKDLPLWDSNYPHGAEVDNPVYAPWHGREYGGFAEPLIYQFKGTTTLCGQSVDLNWERDDMGISRLEAQQICEEFMGRTVRSYIDAYFDPSYPAPFTDAEGVRLAPDEGVLRGIAEGTFPLFPQAGPHNHDERYATKRHRHRTQVETITSGEPVD